MVLCTCRAILREPTTTETSSKQNGFLGWLLTDPVDRVWRLQDIYAVTGLLKLMEVSPAVQNVPTETTSRSAAAYSLTRQID